MDSRAIEEVSREVENIYNSRELKEKDFGELVSGGGGVSGN